MTTAEDFMAKLAQGKEAYQEEQKSGIKRRRFTPGLEIHGRLLPYDHEGNLRFLEPFYHHYFESVHGDGYVFLTCPKNGNDWDAHCDFCDFSQAHYKERGSDRIYNLYKRKKKFKVNFFPTKVLTVENYTVEQSDIDLWKEVLNTVIVIDLPFTLKSKIDMALNKDDIGLDIFNPVNGFDIQIIITLKKTEEDTFPDYSLSDFSRSRTSLPVDDISKLLADTTNLIEAIDTLKKADLEKITPAARKEGLVSSESAPESSDSSLPDMGAESAPAENTTPPSSDTSASSEPAEERPSLQDIFQKYRKDS